MTRVETIGLFKEDSYRIAEEMGHILFANSAVMNGFPLR
jgi:hypothetical protein